MYDAGPSLFLSPLLVEISAIVYDAGWLSVDRVFLFIVKI